MSLLAYIDGPRVTDEVREAVPEGARFRRAKIPAVEKDATTVIIGPPDKSAEGDPNKPTVRAHWAEVKEVYERETKDPESDVNATVKVADALDPLDGAESRLAAVVGTRQANALEEAGYGSVEAAQALDKEDLVDIDGVGDGTYDKLHD